MIAVIQRVKRASVVIDERVAGECGRGLMVLLGVAEGDTRLDAELLAAKMTKLRIFSDDSGKMNLSVKDVDGELLVVSNFTLLANYVKGNRPDYMNSASTRCVSLKNTAYYSIIILFNSFCTYLSFRTASVKLCVNKFIVNFDAGSEPVYDGADGISMAFAEKSHFYGVAKSIFH